MKITKQARKHARELYHSCLVDGVIDEQKALKIADLLIQYKPRGYLPILKWFFFLVKQNIARRTAVIETAIELSPEEMDRFKTSIQKRVGTPLTFVFRTNPDIIGGVQVQLGDRIWDNSIQARLKLILETIEK